MNLAILDTAAQEVSAAATYYEDLSPSQGERFLLEFQRSVIRICDNPSTWQPISGNVRRLRMDVFPYGVLYAHSEDEIVVLCVGHLHRRPSFWRRGARRRR